MRTTAIPTTLRLGTRPSQLALAQARIAAAELNEIAERVEIVPISTRGDAISARSPRGRWTDADGQFTRELEAALVDGRVDVVVHSLKDLPTEASAGVVIAAVLKRGDARDCLVTADGRTLLQLRSGARLGTSSPRRAAQIAAVRPDVVPMPIRGNVDSRIRRMEAGEFDGVILAAAGLDRLGVAVTDGSRLDFEVMLPAPAQGALALQVRSDDTALVERVMMLDHHATRVAVEAERSLLRRIGGGCLAPLGALGQVTEGNLRLRAAFEPTPGAYRRAEAIAPVDRPDAAVRAVAERILQT